MPYIKSTQPWRPELYYEDNGDGQPIIFIHGWPLSGEMWEYQTQAIIPAGFRCICFDRRGFGRSEKPFEPYNYDDFATDLNVLINELNLEQVILVGFSMGGGEIPRYLSKFNDGRIAKVVFISSIVPYLLKTGTHPHGVPSEVFDDMIRSLQDDRPAFLKEFGKTFFGVGLLNSPVSEAMLQWIQQLALMASPKASIDCIRAFSETDFRQDLSSINIPTLIIHGDHDKIVPAEATSNLLAEALPHAEYMIYQGAPHGLFITHKDRLNNDLINFFRK